MGKPVVETVVFNGNTYRRYPASKRRQHRVYFQYHGESKATPRYLHRDIWVAAYGAIPDGYEIHHDDGNPLNNDLGNLLCVTKAEHRRLDAARGANRTPAVLANLDRIRPLAAAWHGTPEGLAHHRAIGAKSIASKRRNPTRYACIQCGEPFTSIGPPSKFCSGRCASKHRRESGVDDVDRRCVVCPEMFRVNRYVKTKRCPVCRVGRDGGV